MTLKPYTQYNQCKQLIDWCDKTNDYIKLTFDEFFKNFKASLDTKNINVNKDYLFFYLTNYYGINRIPSPSTTKSMAKYVYDAGVKFDNNGRYDELASADSTTSLFMNPDLFVAIALFQINYSYQVFSIPTISFLLKEIYYAYTQSELDLNKVSFIQHKDILEVKLPDEDVWDQIILVATYSPELLGLPFGKYIDFTKKVGKK